SGDGRALRTWTFPLCMGLCGSGKILACVSGAPGAPARPVINPVADGITRSAQHPDSALVLAQLARRTGPRGGRCVTGEPDRRALARVVMSASIMESDNALRERGVRTTGSDRSISTLVQGNNP